MAERKTLQRRRGSAGLVRRLARSRSGATAVEFALVAAPFFFMLFAIMELGVVFALANQLENATVAASREIRTGQLQTGAGGAADDFAESVCSRMTGFESQCRDNLSIDVRIMEQFSDAPPDPVAGGEFNEGTLTYEGKTSQPGDIVLVRSFYRHTLFTPFLNQALSRLDDGTTIITAAAVFRNEPYL